MRLTSIKIPAFSLVEIAIALVIMGIILGGVLKGKDLLESARLKTVISQVNQYKLATHTFYDQYGALPGDFHQAKAYINAELDDGNHNGEVEGLGLGGGDSHEALSFWRHLQAADMIVLPHNTAIAVPALKIGGVVTISYDPEETLKGHWFILGKQHGQKGTGALLTPLQALNLARKIDSEDPFSGTVQVRDGTNATGCMKDSLIDAKNKNVACTLYVRL